MNAYSTSHYHLMNEHAVDRAADEEQVWDPVEPFLYIVFHLRPQTDISPYNWLSDTWGSFSVTFTNKSQLLLVPVFICVSKFFPLTVE